MRYFATSVDGVKATGMCIVLLFQADSKALHVPGGGLVTEPQVGERPEAAAASPTGSSPSVGRAFSGSTERPAAPKSAAQDFFVFTPLHLRSL